MSIQSKPPLYWRIVGNLLNIFFKHLYHNYAWLYDLVADMVSLGMWKDWVRASIGYAQGCDILELGHGPGHLQAALIEGGFHPFAIDESRQMGQLALRRLRRSFHAQAARTDPGQPELALTRALAQSLPFPSSRFDTILATFPSGYIFEEITLSEVRRVLRPGGRLVIFLSASIEGTTPLLRLIALLFRLTGETIPWQSRLAVPFQRAGLDLHVEWAPVRSAKILVLIAQKSGVPVVSQV